MTSIFEISPTAVDDFIAHWAASAGFSTAHGVERSGFVPTFRRIILAAGYGADSQSRRRPMAEEIAVVMYLFNVFGTGVRRPDGFHAKSVVPESVEGPHYTDSVRISLRVPQSGIAVSREPIWIGELRSPSGKPRTFDEARTVLGNAIRIMLNEANALVPVAHRLVSVAPEGL